MTSPFAPLRPRPTLAALLLGLAVASSAEAQDANLAPAAPGEWRFGVTPYLFLPVTTTGTSTVAGVEADLDIGVSNLFDVLNFAGSARAEAWRGSFGLIVDGYYVNIGGGTDLTLPGPGGAGARADVSVKQGWVAVMGGWRFYQGTVSAGDDRRFAVDTGVGFRYNNLRQRIDADFDIGPADGVQTRLGGTEVWFEPVIALRGGVELSDAWTLGARAEVGGFGAGGSDIHWNVLFGADYEPWEDVSLKIGWQFYGLDFETERSDGTFAYDVFQTGPYLGGTFRF